VPINVTLNTVEVFEKEDARFDAIINRPIVKKETSWMFNKEKLVDTSKHTLQSAEDSLKHSIIIHDCNLDDSGEYVFNVRNKKTTVNLNVKGIK